jgi:phage terminase large subunit-like protein
MVEAGRLKVVAGEWNDKYLAQLGSFPKAQHDEAVDTTVYALNYLLPAKEFFAEFI